ncbi:MAG: hypothetical protein ACFFD4_16600 [Candidatus Odinarchaeota archaeon]
MNYLLTARTRIVTCFFQRARTGNVLPADDLARKKPVQAGEQQDGCSNASLNKKNRSTAR